VNNVYLVDVAAIGAFYADWTRLARALPTTCRCRTCRSIPRARSSPFPAATSKAAISPATSRSRRSTTPTSATGVQESVKHAWYKGGKGALHPYKGETIPQYTDFQDNGKYSWVKSPTFYGDTVQVGPLARVLAWAAAKYEPGMRHLNRVIGMAESIAKTKIPLEALHSTIGRHAARSVVCASMVENLQQQWQLLVETSPGRREDLQQAGVPERRGERLRFPRGAARVLSHWVVIKDGAIKNYQRWCRPPGTPRRATSRTWPARTRPR